ncbi:MAG TPA: DUF805 domain-containing protein [Allosphingosinicella sp.]|jgi:uncharacterized membrane protein YhaH (DUF805 family)
MEWMILPLKRYADFSGRSRRKEYWMFALGLAIVYVLFFVVLFGAMGLGANSSTGELGVAGSMFAGTAGIAFLVFVLAIIVPSLAVQVRRFHDQDKSGWFVLLNFIPYVGGIIVLVMMCLEGTKGPNRFGPDPKEENLAEVFS